jgi:phosphatidylinositol alpha-1,6-mannosyltransferase
MPKALLFTTDFAPSKGGGICTHSNFMAESLTKLGWKFSVLCEYYIPSTDEAINNYALKSGLEIHRLPSAPSKFHALKKILFCLKICRKFKPDVIIGTGRHPTWFASFTSMILRIPLVTIGHGTEFTQSTSKYDFKINKWAYSRANLIISISEYTKKIIINAGIKNNNIAVIHNPANEQIFKILDEELVKSFKLEKNIKHRKIILTVGSLSERKGQHVVVKCLPKIIKQHPEVMYVAIGPPIRKEQLYELANSLGVQNNIFFPGVVSEDELVLWLNACVFFAMTSVDVNGSFEGYGIAVVEAALCGKASIVSSNGGLKEAVIHHKTGLIVCENNIEKTTEAILEVLNNEVALRDLSKNAFEDAIQNNTWQTVGLKYNHYLKQLLKND